MKERCQLLDPVPHVPHVEHPRLVSDEVGDQRLQLTEAQRERQTPYQRPHAHAAVTTDVGIPDGLCLLVLIGEVDLVTAGPNHRVATQAFPDVQLRPVQHHINRRVDRHR